VALMMVPAAGARYARMYFPKRVRNADIVPLHTRASRRRDDRTRCLNVWLGSMRDRAARWLNVRFCQ
jgi:hypothetical protein